MHKKIWQLATPIILANVTVPLLEAVDIAIVGHLPGPQYMASVGIGATIFNTLFFGFVFLRMGTTGLVAIAKGNQDNYECTAWVNYATMVASDYNNTHDAIDGVLTNHPNEVEMKISEKFTFTSPLDLPLDITFHF